jgi:hypothetical protein
VGELICGRAKEVVKIDAHGKVLSDNGECDLGCQHLLSCDWSDAFDDMKVCYVLDAILIAYSIVLTVLYIRLKVRETKPKYNQSFIKKTFIF